MAVDFPANPNTGDEFVVNGLTYRFEGGAWVAPGGFPPPDPYVLKSGDTMTGPLTLQSANPSQDYHAVPRKFLMDELAKKPAIPVNATDVAGGVFVIASAAGAGVSLPAGGTWLAFRQQFNTSTGTYAFVHQMSVLPGGHTFSAPASPFAWVGWAWRIA